MAIIREPEGVDFVVEPHVLTDKDRRIVAEHIRAHKAKQIQEEKKYHFKMNKVVFSYIVILALAVAATLTSCNKDIIDDDKDAIMKFTTAKSGRVLFTIAGDRIATIDWGDGLISTVTLVPLELNICAHDYSSATSRTITITGKYITYFDCILEELTSVDVSENAELIYLDISCNNITHLDVSKNTVLEILGCGWNELSTSALNNLFETLHSYEIPKKIIIHGNPGTNSCNEKIATDKGWIIAISPSD